MAITSSAELPGGASRDDAATVQEVRKLSALKPVKAANSWFKEHGNDLAQTQMELTSIPAPPFGEAARADWLRERFRELGLKDIHIDEIGNVFGVRPGFNDNGRIIAITAHLDTVFPAGTKIEVRRDGDRLYGPGISDNGAGLAALLAVATALKAGGVQTNSSIVFIGNVGEEGEGDVRGMRHIFSDPKWKNSIAYTIVVDGAGTDTIVTDALGSRRFQVTVKGPGGHSWSDFGAPNPIVALAHAIDLFTNTPVPPTPKTTFNIGVISGGTSVNSIPESASMRVDIRSASPEQIDRLERALNDSLEEALRHAARSEQSGSRGQGLSFEVKCIGNRPAARLRADSRLLQTIQAVDEFLGNRARIQRASTDANIPISQGREALAIGAGGSGGGAHTVHEWYDVTNRELGLRRILLTALALAGVKE